MSEQDTVSVGVADLDKAMNAIVSGVAAAAVTALQKRGSDARPDTDPHSHRRHIPAEGHTREVECDYLAPHRCDMVNSEGITTLEDLKTHLKWAMKIELTTIPPYLFALYSLEEAPDYFADGIRTVVVEEMLHVSLAANLLLSVGGTPRLLDPHVVPTYPTVVPMQHCGLTVTM
jgi:Ferritin-like